MSIPYVSIVPCGHRQVRGHLIYLILFHPIQIQLCLRSKTRERVRIDRCLFALPWNCLYNPALVAPTFTTKQLLLE